ncbi:MAG TPA: aldehyde dehydrogenase family protein [Steroidobacteraceae bacterium]|nr:aldehyde dehydrogenase family protein [Steroidobacteraceae bacterium]
MQQVEKHLVYMDGEWTPSTGRETLAIVNPATEEVIGESASGTAEDVAKAVDCARRAFAHWSQRPLAERCDWLERLHALYLTRTEELALIITAEMGAPITLSRQVHTRIPGDVIADTVNLAREYPYAQRMDGSLIVREAYGVVGAITPWNNPLYMMFLKALPALAAGCTVVHKPAEATPFSTQLVANMMNEVGFPKGVYNLVTGTGHIVGAAISGHPGVDLVSFTGSTSAGALVAANAAKSVTPVVLELGGKSANVVLDDGDLDLAVEHGMRSAFNNAGQMCGAWTRMVVPRRRIGEITERCVAIAKRHVVGDPLDPETTMGPVVSARQRDTIMGLIRSGIEQGATLALGGPERPKGLARGFYVQPTIFTNVDNSMRIAQEEIFGPVLSIIPHGGDDDAIRIANDSKYGLRGAVFSRDADRALCVARRLRTGQVDINGYKLTIDIPFGGYKQSGYGRCQGRYGFEEFLQIKSIQL